MRQHLERTSLAKFMATSVNKTARAKACTAAGVCGHGIVDGEADAFILKTLFST